MSKDSENFKPPMVSRWFRFDWQYAVDVSHIPVLQFASIVIAVTPIVLSDWNVGLSIGALRLPFGENAATWLW